MNGVDWMKALHKKSDEELCVLRTALTVLRGDEDINREYNGQGLFSGFPNLLMLVEDEQRERERGKKSPQKSSLLDETKELKEMLRNDAFDSNFLDGGMKTLALIEIYEKYIDNILTRVKFLEDKVGRGRRLD